MLKPLVEKEATLTAGRDSAVRCGESLPRIANIHEH